MSRISLCVIAKNEERMLPGCLESVKGWVDEIVVADTGSADRTVEIAREHGAVVVHHAWRNDFAAARNAAVEAATGDWILVLDADERLAEGAGAALRKAAQRGGFDCGMMPLHNASRLDATPEEILSGRARVGEAQLLPRFLRRVGELRWNGMIHESVTRWLVEGGRAAAALPAHIIHFGAVPSYREQLKKSERNIGLLEIRAAEEPENPTPRGYLAYECLKAGQGDRAAAEVDAAWALLSSSRAASIQGPDAPQHAVVPIANLRAHLQIQRGDIPGALATLDAAQAWNPPHPNLDLLEGAAWEQQALNRPHGAERTEDLGRAAAAYRRCLDHHGQIFSDEVNPGATSWAALTRLGSVFLALSRFTDAQAAFDGALAHRPDHLEARFGRADAALHLGRADEALAALEPHLDEVPEGLDAPVADGWILAAAAAEAAGRWESFSFLLDQAAARANQRCLGLHRRKLLRELSYTRSIGVGRDVAGPGIAGHLSALLSRRPVSPPMGEGQPIVDGTPEAGRARRALIRLLTTGRGARLETLFEPRAEQLLPGIGAFTEALFAELGVSAEDEDEPDFILIGGAGRSGTTLFRAMIDAHPRLCCGPEAKLIPPMVTMRDQWWQSMGPHLKEAGVDEAVLDGAVKAFVAAMLKGIPRALGQGGGVRVAEKTPHNLLHMAYLGRLFPRARFIHVVRDGRAVAASLVKQRWIDPSTGNPLWYCQDLESAARYWAGVVDAVHAQVPQVKGRYLEVRYEALVQDPGAELARVLAFLGERWEDAVLSHHEHDVALPPTESSSAAVAERVHTEAIDKWRGRLADRDIAVIEAAAGPTLRRLGYVERSPSVGALPGAPWSGSAALV